MTDKYKEMLRAGRTSEDYLDSYRSIIHGATGRLLDKSKIDFYTEVHHIVPKCMGGTNDESNLVLLSFEEHIVAHLLLSFAYEDNLYLASAANAMLNLINEQRKQELIQNSDLLEKYIDEGTRAKNLFIKNKSTAVVCYDYYSFNIIKIYNSIRHVREDGFSEWHVRECIYKHTRLLDGKEYQCAKSVKGYRFELLSEFELLHKDEINDYYKKLENGEDIIISPKPYVSDRSSRYNGRIVALNDFGDIVGVFGSTKEAAEKCRTTEESLKASVRRENKLHGFYWNWESNYPAKESVGGFDQYLNKYTAKFLVVKYDLSTNQPIKLYSSVDDITLDGYCARQVQDVISGRIDRYIKSSCGWAYFKDYIIKFPEQIELLRKIY